MSAAAAAIINATHICVGEIDEIGEVPSISPPSSNSTNGTSSQHHTVGLNEDYTLGAAHGPHAVHPPPTPCTSLPSVRCADPLCAPCAGAGAALAVYGPIFGLVLRVTHGALPHRAPSLGAHC